MPARHEMFVGRQLLERFFQVESKYQKKYLYIINMIDEKIKK